MPIPFQITERLAGFVATSAKKGEMTSVVYRDLLSPSDAELTERLEKLHSCLFSKIPNLPDPSRIGQLIIVISTDLFANAYVDELQTIAIVKPNRAVAKGDPLFLGDIIDIDSVDLGIEVPPDAGIVVVRSFLWKRSLFFDFGPLHFDVGPRDYPLGKALAQQMLLEAV